ncbi:MAG: cation diffusion facilitator family transporter [Phycisphaerae bacterium]
MVNLSLMLAKVAGGLVFRSQAILADGVHSATDLVTDFAILAGLRFSSQPADGRHPYGHHRISTLVAMFVGILLLGAGGWIGYQAVMSLREGREGTDALVPFLLAVGTIPLKEVLFRLTRAVGRSSGDVSVRANAWHHRSDAFTSLAAAVGIGGVLLGGPDWAFLDHVTAVLLSVFLAVAAVRIIHESAGELIDASPDEETLAQMTQIIGDTPGVRDYHAVRARRLGGRIEMDLHVLVDPMLTVEEGHEIATNVKRKLLKSPINVSEVIVHIEPAGEAPDPNPPRDG